MGESWPEIPEWAAVDGLAPDVLRDLRGLSKEGAEFVALHLVAAGTLAEVEPELAWRHARAARSKGGRIAVVRETVGLVAYRAGEWTETIAELRAARRMGGGPGHLAVMADSERALGNPEKAIEMSRSTEAAELDEDGKLELTIVVAGARADLGQIDTALVVLEGSGVLEDDADARLLYAYADLLAAAGRTEEALDWFMKAHDADEDDETDAAERIAELAAGDDEDEDEEDDDSDDDDSDSDDSDDVPGEPDGSDSAESAESDLAESGDAESEVIGSSDAESEVDGAGDRELDSVAVSEAESAETEAESDDAGDRDNGVTEHAISTEHDDHAGADESDDVVEAPVEETSDRVESPPAAPMDLPLFSDDLFSDNREDSRDPNERR